MHELSHIACKTEDIAYLDPGRPFADLIGTASPTASDLKNELSHIQDTALSIKTPYTQLFMTQDPDTGEWEDLGSTTYEDTDRVKAHILTVDRRRKPERRSRNLQEKRTDSGWRYNLATPTAWPG